LTFAFGQEFTKPLICQDVHESALYVPEVGLRYSNEGNAMIPGEAYT
jgi:hypothetical protein